MVRPDVATEHETAVALAVVGVAVERGAFQPIPLRVDVDALCAHELAGGVRVPMARAIRVAVALMRLHGGVVADGQEVLVGRALADAYEALVERVGGAT